MPAGGSILDRVVLIWWVAELKIRFGPVAAGVELDGVGAGGGNPGAYH